MSKLIDDFIDEAELRFVDEDRDHYYRFAELIIHACIYECKQATYDAMAAKIEPGEGELKEFYRGAKSGRKFGASECVTRLKNKFQRDE